MAWISQRILDGTGLYFIIISDYQTHLFYDKVTSFSAHNLAKQGKQTNLLFQFPYTLYANFKL